MYRTKIRCAVLPLALFALGSLCLCAQDSGVASEQSAAETSYVPVHAYDRARDAAGDIDSAIAEARKAGKRVLVEIGGDWCPWCRSLEKAFQEHPDLLQLREAQFITVDVYYGADYKNEQALSRYSKVLGIPHLFVLDGDGKLLHSQHVVEFQANGNYSPDKVKDFLVKWSKPVTSPADLNPANLR